MTTGFRVVSLTCRVHVRVFTHRCKISYVQIHTLGCKFSSMQICTQTCKFARHAILRARVKIYTACEFTPKSANSHERKFAFFGANFHSCKFALRRVDLHVMRACVLK